MKNVRYVACIILGGLIVTMGGCSKQEKTIGGTLIGAGTGALIGSAAGGTTGGIIGAIGGGAIGGIIGHSSGDDK